MLFRSVSVKEDQLLGTMPDREAASLLKRSVSAVRSRRKLKEIPYINPAQHQWTETEVSMCIAKSIQKSGRS